MPFLKKLLTPEFWPKGRDPIKLEDSRITILKFIREFHPDKNTKQMDDKTKMLRERITIMLNKCQE